MDILSFVFGMLVIIFLVAISGLIAGIVKIMKMSKRIEDHDDDIKNLFSLSSENHNELVKEIETQIKDTISYIDSRIDKAILK